MNELHILAYSVQVDSKAHMFHNQRTIFPTCFSQFLSYRAFKSPLLLLVCFAKILFKGASQLTKQTHFLTILKKTGGSGRLIWMHKHMVTQSRNATFYFQWKSIL